MLTVLAMNLAQGCMPGSPSAELFPDDEVRYGIHGGALETSLMLHLRPELVSIAAAKDFASRAAKQPKTEQQYGLPALAERAKLDRWARAQQG